MVRQTFSFSGPVYGHFQDDSQNDKGDIFSDAVSDAVLYYACKKSAKLGINYCHEYGL